MSVVKSAPSCSSAEAMHAHQACVGSAAQSTPAARSVVSATNAHHGSVGSLAQSTSVHSSPVNVAAPSATLHWYLTVVSSA